MNKFERTYRIDRLYHRFLRPKNISGDRLDDLIEQLEQSGFIKRTGDPDRYEETDKLWTKQYKKELFKIIQSLKGDL